MCGPWAPSTPGDSRLPSGLEAFLNSCAVPPIYAGFGSMGAEGLVPGEATVSKVVVDAARWMRRPLVLIGAHAGLGGSTRCEAPLVSPRRDQRGVVSSVCGGRPSWRCRDCGGGPSCGGATAGGAARLRPALLGTAHRRAGCWGLHRLGGADRPSPGTCPTAPPVQFRRA